MHYNNDTSTALIALGGLVAIKALIDNEFDGVRNLQVNNDADNSAELLAIKDGKRYLIKVVARSRYSRVGKLDDRFRLNSDFHDKVKEQCLKYQAEPYWLAVSFESDTYSIYLGSLECLEGKQSIPMGQQYLAKYQCLAKHINLNIDFGPYLY